jgi:chromosome segregation ATPase
MLAVSEQLNQVSERIMRLQDRLLDLQQEVIGLQRQREQYLQVISSQEERLARLEAERLGSGSGE